MIDKLFNFPPFYKEIFVNHAKQLTDKFYIKTPHIRQKNLALYVLVFVGWTGI
jgi:hypothetical protein